MSYIYGIVRYCTVLYSIVWEIFTYCIKQPLWKEYEMGRDAAAVSRMAYLFFQTRQTQANHRSFRLVDGRLHGKALLLWKRKPGLTFFPALVIYQI